MTSKLQLTLSAVDVGDIRTHRIAFYLPASTDYASAMKSSVFETSARASLAVELEIVGDAEAAVIVDIDAGTDGGPMRKEVARIKFSSPVVAQSDTFALLRGAIQLEFFNATRDLAPSSVHVAPVQEVPGPAVVQGTQVSDSARKPFAALRGRGMLMVVTVVLVAGALIGYGAFRHPQNPDTEQAAATDYSDLQKKIRDQISAAAKSGKPAVNDPNMSNVSIATMRAMGLDPGKANAGCLVGVK